MWEIYDRLIQGIPESWKAEEIVRGSRWAYVKSKEGIGISGLMTYEYRTPIAVKSMEGSSLREVAEYIKSWNYSEATIGLAAINAYYNNPKIAKESGVDIGESMHVEDRIYDPFIMSQNEIRGQKVAVVGHFPYIENLFAPICDVKVIAGEDPMNGDYPPPAAEYILPESDFVLLGGSCLIEKTIPRLLRLSQNAKKITIVGPGTVLSPILFEYGVSDLSSFVVKDHQKAMRLVRGAENGKIYSTGQKVSLKK